MTWVASEERKRASNLAGYLRWLERERGLTFADYHALWRWSTQSIEAFWASLWDYFGIQAAQSYDRVLDTHVMPGAHWFSGARLNYAEHVFRNAHDTRPALLFAAERTALQSMSWPELARQVGALAAALRELGVRPGERVAALLPNTPEALIAFLACASIGAIWTVCSPDFGTRGVLERFQQIEPRVLIVVDGYSYAGKPVDRRADLDTLRQGLPGLQHVVLVPCLDPHAAAPGTLSWPDLIARAGPLQFEQVPFEHPLWILYSSGSTGLPKAIVHGHGGILLEHLKSLGLQNDMKPGDVLLWFTTTGWMMWNLLVSSLLVGSTPLLYDGSAAFPDPYVLWRLAQAGKAARFGAGASYFIGCMKSGLEPRAHADLAALRTIGASGSALPPEAFRWVYDAVKPDVWLAASSGGTDVCSAFLSGVPLLPVHDGSMQGPALGVSACAFDGNGEAVRDRVGELVITEPMPSMPLYFWNDPDNARYHESYFAMYPGVWRHGDWVEFRTNGGVVIHGRSDSTLNRQGVRIGTAEVYRVVEALPEIADSLVVGLERPQGGYDMPLFVVLREGAALTAELQQRIRRSIRNQLTARHLPTDIIAVPAIPRTLNGKKVEVPVKRILLGAEPAQVLNPASLANPAALEFFTALRWNVFSGNPAPADFIVEFDMHGENLELRAARPEERPAIRALTLDAYGEYGQVMQPAAWDALAGAVSSALDTTEPAERIVALHNGELVGSVMLYAASADAYQGAVASTSNPEIRLLAVARNARGRGVGTALVQECIRRARASGAVQLGLHTSASMRVAIQLYEHLGFERAPEFDFQPPGAELVTAYRLDLSRS